MPGPNLIVIVRHAQSEHHVQGLTGGWTDTPLTNVGHEQSRLVAARLREELRDTPVRLYTSDLQRAAQTAGHIAAALGIDPLEDQRLREHNNGVLANLTVEEAEARFPGVWNAPVPLDVAPCPGAETARDVFVRAGTFLDDLPSDGSLPVVVSHGGTIACLIGQWLQLDPRVVEPIGFLAYTTSITVLQADRRSRRMLERTNDVAHLQGFAQGWASIRSLLPG